MRGTWGRARDRITLGALAAIAAFGLFAQNAAAEPPQIVKVAASEVTSTSAALEFEINPQGTSTTFRFEFGAEGCPSVACSTVSSGSIGNGSSPVAKSVPVEGLEGGTLYHYRVVAKHGVEEVSSSDRTFATRTPIFSGLPDGRVYEQASPVNKDGGDVLGDVPGVKAAANGGGITFESSFGIPGGQGAQEFPTYFASRGPGGWSTQGLLPPPSAGERAQVIGWSPDYTEVFSSVSKLGTSKLSALVVESTASGESVQITPYVAKTEFAYAGESRDGSVVLFESPSKIIPRALEGFPNLYAWDRETGQITLAGVTNQETSPLKGTLAGPYAWTAGAGRRQLSLGGADRGFYLQDEHAIAPEGSIFFTEAGTGQLFKRLNPTEEQSDLSEGTKGKCTKSALACTIHVSASHRSVPDTAGSQPAAFQAASADGSEAFFTSPEKLTEDANTGPDQPPAQIELGAVGGTIEKPDFIPKQAVGVAVDGSHVYWANPAAGTIGRANLDGSGIDEDFIEPEPVTFQFEREVKPGVFEPAEETVPSEPRYVAVDADHIYWTNTGRSNEFGPVDEEGTIGRANIGGPTPTEIKPNFIRGTSNPQGIAVNAEYIYWANAARDPVKRSIGRALITGGEVEETFFTKTFGKIIYGLALSPSHIYFSANDEENDFGWIRRIPLEGGKEEFVFVGKAGVRGVAIAGSDIYWATQGEEEIGHIPIADFPELGGCEVTDGCEGEFIKLEGKPNGVAANAEHLFWATNGEAATNPGNDLYRYGPGEEQLEDLTPDPTDTNGAEVQGVLGASADGKYLYFAANGVLDEAEEAEPGDCKGTVGSASGSCSLYLWHEGTIELVGRLKSESGSPGPPDSLNWTATPRDQFGTSSYVPKTSFVSADGRALLFRSQEKLTPYDNDGVPEFYRFKVGQGISCVSCNPAGEAAKSGPRIESIAFPGLGPLASVAAVSARILSASGDQAFFETSEALVPADTNGQGGCLPSGTSNQNYPACDDVYEWEAAGAGGCQEGGPAYSPINSGCIYLISSGKSEFPSLFADASADGKDVFFFTRDQLVGQDKDQLQDVYDARVQGGLAAQSPVAAVPCEGAEACHGPAQTPPVESTPATSTFLGPGNQAQKHKKQKAKKKSKKHKKHHSKKAKAKPRRSR